MLFVETLFA